MKRGWFLAQNSLPSLCPRTHSLMPLMSNLKESRKPASKNSKSCFTKSLKNTKAQITLLTDCSNSVSQKGRGGDFLEESGVFGHPHQVKKQQCPRGGLDTKRDSAAHGRRNIRVQQILPNSQGEAQAHMGTHSVDPLVMGDMA